MASNQNVSNQNVSNQNASNQNVSNQNASNQNASNQNVSNLDSLIFKYGEKVYSLASLRSGWITDINLEGKTVTIDRGEKWGQETISTAFITRDVEKILELLREQVEEYKESFFRVRDTLRRVEARG